MLVAGDKYLDEINRWNKTITIIFERTIGNEVCYNSWYSWYKDALQVVLTDINNREIRSIYNLGDSYTVRYSQGNLMT